MWFRPGSEIMLLRKIPATLVIIAANIFAFAISFFRAGSLSGNQWTMTLLDQGALFNPLTLDGEWYRIFSHMFLHGSLLHLAVNMYALFSVGSEMERLTGTKKFVAIYFVCGTAAAINSMYWSLFTIGVGASGAIFGLFGFTLIADLFFSRRSGKSLFPILFNFALFVGINLLIAESVNADNAAHFGGLATGIVIGLFAIARPTSTSFRRLGIEFFLMALIAALYFVMPRFQVSYYKFFQQVIAAEDSTRLRTDQNLTDNQYLEAFARNILQWDSTRMLLDQMTYLPAELETDTFKLRRYIGLRKKENDYKKTIIERESYIYLDSVSEIQRTIPQYLQLDYSLKLRAEEEKKPLKDTAQRPVVKAYYDDDWIEVPEPPATYFRLGFKDSAGRWDGIVQDFYENGDVQMKGVYSKNKRDGVFLYYSDHRTYTSSGRYVNDQPVGKWEIFHNNGLLASEVYYNNGYFLKSLWDSLGNQLVVGGNGKVIQRYPNGVVAEEGSYEKGVKQGYWYGLHPDGKMYFEENYKDGRLLSGRSRNRNGESFVYDASSLFPIPVIGFVEYRKYVASETARVPVLEKGQVRLSFRVTKGSVVTDVSIEQSLTPALDEKAKDILLSGPQWQPAKVHGHEPVDGFGFLVVGFE